MIIVNIPWLIRYSVVYSAHMTSCDCLNKFTTLFSRPDWIEVLSGSFVQPRTDEEIGSILRAIAETAGVLGGVPFAAATTDNTGRIIEINIDQRVPLNDNSIHSARVVMLNTKRILGEGVNDLQDVSLHILDTDNIESIGQIWLFAPGRVVMHPYNVSGSKSDFMPSKIPAASDFWELAKQLRGIDLTRVSQSDGDSLPISLIESVLAKQKGKGLGVEVSKNQPFPRPAWVEDTRESWSKLPSPREIMQLLHKVAKENVRHGGGPFAAAVVDKDGQIIDLNVNLVVPLQDCGAHAEKMAMTNACHLLNVNDLKGYTVYSSSAPCIGCSEQITHLTPDCIISAVPKSRVEAQSPFTEGPVKETYWEEVENMYGIKNKEEFCYAEDQALADAPFVAFMKAIKENPAQSYLEKHGTAAG